MSMPESKSLKLRKKCCLKHNVLDKTFNIIFPNQNEWTEARRGCKYMLSVCQQWQITHTQVHTHIFQKVYIVYSKHVLLSISLMYIMSYMCFAVYIQIVTDSCSLFIRAQLCSSF